MHAIGGLLKHAPALCAFANPTTNSYKRLVPGFEAPTKLSYSRRNRAAVIRIPVHSPSPKSRRIEFRVPDSAANPYLLYSAMLMAALDGIQTKTRPGDPLDKDVYDLQPEELADVPGTPRSLDASLDALRADHEFLLRGDVFTPRRHRYLDLVQAVRVQPLLRRLRADDRRAASATSSLTSGRSASRSNARAPTTSMLSAKLKMAQSKPTASTWKWTKSRTRP